MSELNLHGPDELTSAPQIQWAADRLRVAYAGQQGPDLSLRLIEPSQEATLADLGDLEVVPRPESYASSVQRHPEEIVASVVATDTRGFTYAINELADRPGADAMSD